MSRRIRNISLNLVLTVMGIAVLGLGWQLVQRLQVAPVVAQQVVSLADTYPSASDIYQVEVRNAAGAPGAAETLRTYLIGKGYDVVGVGNHTSFDENRTRIVDRVGNAFIARQVAASLGLGEEYVMREERPALELDVSIILGKDYHVLPPFADAAKSGKQE